jgi:hypothetical protein
VDFVASSEASSEAVFLWAHTIPFLRDATSLSLRERLWRFAVSLGKRYNHDLIPSLLLLILSVGVLERHPGGLLCLLGSGITVSSYHRLPTSLMPHRPLR